MKDRRRPRTREVLYVEDNPGDIDLVREALKQGPADARLHATSGAEALDILLHRAAPVAAPRPDLVLLDLKLAMSDGRELLREIRAAGCTVPVVIFTGSDAAEDIEEAYRLGANGYVTKPVDLDDYLARVQATLSYWFDVCRLPGD